MTESERSKIRHRADRNELIRLLPGVYIPFHYIPADRNERQMLGIAAAALGYKHSIVVGKTAAILHGLARTTEELASKEIMPVELATVTHRSARRRAHHLIATVEHRRVVQGVVDRSKTMHTEFGPVRVASVLDTCEQLALWHDLDVAVVGIEDALNRKKLSPTALQADRLKGRKGVRRARQALNLVTPWSESPRETELKLRLWREGLPAPMQQVEIRRHTGEFLGRVDFMFECGLIVEYDGASKHKSRYIDPSDVFLMERTLNEERARERRIAGLGYEFVRVDQRRFRDGSGVEDVIDRLADMRENPPSLKKRSNWVWTAKGKAWRDRGDQGWLG